jgi:PAS domain S-box-containing protein
MQQFERDSPPVSETAGAGDHGRTHFSPADDAYSFLKRLTDGYLQLDAEFRVLDVNGGAQLQIGVTRTDLLGRVLWQVLPRVAGTTFEEECRRALRTGKPARYEGPSLGYLGLEAESYLCPDGNGLRIYLRNLASRDRTESALRASEAKYRKLVSLLPAAVYTCDAEGRITLFNQRAAALWGREPRLYDEDDKYCGSFKLYSVYEQPIRHQDCWMGLTLRTGVPFRDQKIIIERPDGSRIVVSANVEPLFDEDGRLTGAINVLQDVTDRQRAEVHDRLQQLLVAARMQVETMNRGASPSADPLVQRVASILDDAVATSRNLSVELHSSVYQPSEFVAALVWLSALMEERYGLKVHFRDDRRMPPAEASEQVSAVLLESTRELLTNCVKHAKVQSAQVTLEQSPDHQIIVVVEDQGCGFDPAIAERSHTSGFRFGLFKVRQKLMELGGQMQIHASPGRGVRVLLSAPVKTLALLPKRDSQPGLPEQQAADEGIRVLLVDDHKILREGLARLLKGEPDIEIVGEAEDGVEAVRLAASLLPDVVVMDINLPRMNGIEATRSLRRKTPSVKVVALSMHGEEDIKTRMKEAGAEAYVLKGAPAAELVDAIRNCAQ